MPSMIVGTKRDGEVGIKADCLFLFAVTPKVADVNGDDVIPAWDASAIPSVFSAQVPDAWKTAIAAGDAGFCRATIEQRVGESVQDFATYAWVHFDAVVAKVIADKRALAAETGDHDLQRFSLSR